MRRGFLFCLLFLWKLSEFFGFMVGVGICVCGKVLVFKVFGVFLFGDVEGFFIFRVVIG